MVSTFQFVEICKIIWGGGDDFLSPCIPFYGIYLKKILSIILHLFEMFTYSFVKVLFLRNVFVRQITVLHKDSVFEHIVIAQTAIGAMQL